MATNKFLLTETLKPPLRSELTVSKCSKLPNGQNFEFVTVSVRSGFKTFRAPLGHGESDGEKIRTGGVTNRPLGAIL